MLLGFLWSADNQTPVKDGFLTLFHCHKSNRRCHIRKDAASAWLFLWKDDNNKPAIHKRLWFYFRFAQTQPADPETYSLEMCHFRAGISQPGLIKAEGKMSAGFETLA